MKALILAVLFIFSMLSVVTYAADAVPKKVMEKIEAKAIRDFPDNFVRRKDQIRNQAAAYNEIKNYKNNKVPPDVLEKIKTNKSQFYPHDYSAQLFLINKQVNSYIKLGVLSSRLFPVEIVKCKDLRWKLAVRGRPAIYRGTVKPGSVDVIYVEVRNSRGLIGQNFGFPNPGGAWEIMVWGDYNIKARHIERFYCEKY